MIRLERKLQTSKRRSEKKFAPSSSNNPKNAIPAMHNMALRFCTVIVVGDDEPLLNGHS